jgi:flagellin-specific chaperone FliS
VTVFLFSLIFLIKPIHGLYDISELEDLRAYCFLHADRAAKGEIVVNDLIKSGLANSTYQDWSCIKVNETLEAEEQSAAAATKTEAQEKQLELIQKFNQIVNESGVNLSLPQGGELSSKLQELKDSDAFKELYQKFSQAVQDLGQGNRTGELSELQQLNKSINDLNGSNVTDATTNEFDNEVDDNSGVGYYDPPYSYTQCLTVFTKEMCDFRFNSN